MDPREQADMVSRNGGNAASASAHTLAALGIAELRTSVSSELARIKDDIGELHEKINAVKDGVATDKIALITQLNQEFTSLNRRLSDFSVALQGLMSDAQHSGETLHLKLEAISSDFEHKMESIRTEITRLVPETRLAELDNSVSELRRLVERVESSFSEFMEKHETADDDLSGEIKRYVNKKVANVSREQDAVIAQLREDITKLQDNDAKHKAKLLVLDKRVTKLAAKVTAGVAALAWILNALFGDNAKSMVGKLVSPTTQSVIEAPAKAGKAAVDGTGTVKDSSPSVKPAGTPR